MSRTEVHGFFPFASKSRIMWSMAGGADIRGGDRLGSSRSAWTTVLIFVLLLGAYVRLEGLGVRSLWRDELCTWHVSRMNLAESLRWGPELTKPPLYQFCLRLLTRDPHPSEWMLRLPAAVCGVLTVLGGWWLGRIAAGRGVGVALAVLLAVNGLQIDYSQEARPYSMLALGCTLSTVLWYRLLTGARRFDLYAYIVATVLTLHAHYLAGLTVLGQCIWWVVVSARRPARRRVRRPLFALVVTGALCVPLAYRYLCYKSSMFQGLEWIKPPTWSGTLAVLGQLTFGWQWVFGVLIPLLLLWSAGAWGLTLKRLRRSGGGPLFGGREDICGLLLLCVASAWGGLAVISWAAHPAMVARYALPAAVPAMLLPLVVARRLHRRAPVIIAAVFAIAAFPDSISRRFDPGLREMARYLEERVDPRAEVVVLTMDNTIYPGWEDSERLGFRYYPMRNVPLEELYVEADGVTARNDVLQDPRGLYLVVLWADPFPILEAAGRRAVPIEHEGRHYSQLLFTPYRLVRVAPLPTG